MASLLFVSGAWHGAWCWRLVRPLLERAGHHVAAPDLPGMCDDTSPLTTLDRDAWADFLGRTARALPVAPILVAHSRGGLTASDAAERHPSAFAGLIFLAAATAPDGVRLEEHLVGAMRHDGEAIRSLPGDGGAAFLPDPDQLARLFYQRTTPALAAEAIAHVAPEPVFSQIGMMRATPERFGALPKAYIACRDDRAIPLPLQHRFAASVGLEPAITLDSDHSPFFSCPEALTQALTTLAESHLFRD